MCVGGLRGSSSSQRRGHPHRSQCTGQTPAVRGRKDQETGLYSLLPSLSCRFTSDRRRSTTLRAQPITVLTHRSLSPSMPLRQSDETVGACGAGTVAHAGDGFRELTDLLLAEVEAAAGRPHMPLCAVNAGHERLGMCRGRRCRRHRRSSLSG
jgi:hypothetical protein